MPDRIFGAIKGAGTQVREVADPTNIEAGEYGSTVTIGVFERGAENDITMCPTKAAQKRKMGGALDPRDFAATTYTSLEAARSSYDFWEHSNDSGNNTCLRVVPTTVSAPRDDQVKKSTLNVFSTGNDTDSPQVIGSLTAHNGGRWAGRRRYYGSDITGTPATDFPTANTVQLSTITAVGGINPIQKDEFKGGTLDIHGITTKTYTIVSNDELGLITVGAEEDVSADWTAAGPPGDLEATIYTDNVNARSQEKYMSVQFGRDSLDPTSYFTMVVTVDGTEYLKYENLSMDTNHAWYWKDVIENDPKNDLLTVTDSFSGDRTLASSMPANRAGLSKTLAANVLTLDDPYIMSISSSTGWLPVLSAITLGGSIVPQVITLEVDNVVGPTITVTSSISDITQTAVAAGAVTMNKFQMNFTWADGGTAGLGDTATIYLRPLYTDELIGGTVLPDTAGTERYKIVDNTATTVTVTASDDMTAGATSPSGGENFRLEWPERFGGGYDGYVAGMVIGDYTAVLQPSTTPLKELKYRNKGEVKMMIPGIAVATDEVTLQQHMKLVCREFNWQYRLEIPDSITTDYDAINWIMNTYGKDSNSDLVATYFPSYMKVTDPFAEADELGREISVSVTGMQLGRDALFANQNEGYHRPAAGVTCTLPNITSSAIIGRPNEQKRLDEERLNPTGINVYRWGPGGTIISWGDRTLSNGSNMKFKHKREMLSHYSNVLLEGFDWAIFEINDLVGDAEIAAALISFFRPEHRKRAIRGDQFLGGSNPAAIIKVDPSINTDATRAQGDTYAEVSLRFADTRERLKLAIGAMGISESV